LGISAGAHAGFVSTIEEVHRMEYEIALCLVFGGGKMNWPSTEETDGRKQMPWSAGW